jgi:hypothetical protein
VTSATAAIAAAITPGVKERPPVPGWRYVAFVVHPPRGLCVLAIAHPEGRNVVLDVVKDGLSVEVCCDLLKRYGISSVTAAPDEGGGDSLAHAACGALVLAAKGRA